MLISKFLRDRKSVREFRNKKASEKLLNSIQDSIAEVLKEAEGVNIKFTLYRDGEQVYEGLKDLAGYNGLMIKSPHYIGLEFEDKEDRTQIYGAYYTEKLITLINKLGLDACWVTMTGVDEDKKSEALGSAGVKTDYILAIGYPPLRNPFIFNTNPDRELGIESIYTSAMGHSDVRGKTAVQNTSGERLGVDKIVFKDEIENSMTLEDLEKLYLSELFYYIRFAPSSRNSQPWRFLIKDDKVKLLLAYDKEEDLNLVDAGVIMYYFEEMIKSIGTQNRWELIDGNYQGEQCKYRAIAEFKTRI